MRCDRCEAMEDHRDALRAKLIRTREDYADEVDSLRAQFAAANERVKALEASEASLTRLAQENNNRIAMLEAALATLREKAGCNCDYEDSEEGRRLENSWCLRHGENALGIVSGLTKEGT